MSIGVTLEEGWRDHVDADISALRRENRCAQKFERVAKVEFALRVWVALLQATTNGVSAAFDGGVDWISVRHNCFCLKEMLTDDQCMMVNKAHMVAVA